MVSCTIFVNCQNDIARFRVRKYSFLQRVQNKLAKYCTRRHLLRRYTSARWKLPNGGITSLDFMVKIWFGLSGLRLLVLLEENIRELKQARTATAVNRQLHFTVRNKPHTTNYIYCIFEAHFMIKSVWMNCIIRSYRHY